MFALEISFRDGKSDPELIYIRRQQALIGASEEAHVEVQDMQAVNFQLRLSRDLGRRFRCKPLPLSPGIQVPALLEGVYDEQGVFDVGQVKFVVISMDSDLQLRESETLDRAGVRVLRQACSNRAPQFPSLVVLGDPPLVWSFVPNMPVYIGTSKECGLRLEAPDISAKHARIGFESGEFWVEDLGSTNGTFVRDAQVSGKATLPPCQPITLSKGTVVVGVTSEEQLASVLTSSPAKLKRTQVEERKYPVLISVSEVARPARMVMPIDGTVNIGRDPGSDIWLGAPHVSRRHCSITLGKTGQVSVNDHSTNGTAHDEGVLRRGDALKLLDKGRVLDFGGGVTLAICFNEEQERKFVGSGGSPTIFKPVETSVRGGEMSSMRVKSVPSLAHRLRLDESRKRGIREWLYHFGGIYRNLGIRSKVTFFITLFAVLVVLIVIINLIIHISF